MKKFALVLMVVSIVFASSSCKKDSADPTYTKSQLIGKWKQTSPASEEGLTDYITITETTYKETTAASGVEGSGTPYDYTFDGKALIVNWSGIKVTYTITSLTSTTLGLSVSALGFTSNYTYTKQ